MELTLKLLSGRSAGREIKITTNKFLIGRAEDCHLRPHSELVSRHHCAVIVEEGFCAVRDFGSKNGTFVNGERVVGQVELHNGDQLKVGVLDFEVQLTSMVGGKKRPKVKDVKDAAQRTAAGPARGGDDDISDWLAPDDAAEAKRDTRRIDVKGLTHPPHETPAVSMSNRETTFIQHKTEDTTTIQPMPGAAKTPAQQAQPAEPAKDSAAEKKGVETAKRLFGGQAKGKFSAQNASKDSREAANEALKKLFQTRKP
jgi:predicted component of type VI protein secretion system